MTFAVANCSAVQNVVSQMFCSSGSFFLRLQQMFLIVFVDEKALSLTRITGIMCPGHHDDDDDDVVVVVVDDNDNDDDDEQQQHHHHHHHHHHHNKYDKYCGGGWWSHAPFPFFTHPMLGRSLEEDCSAGGGERESRKWGERVGKRNTHTTHA